MLPKMSTNVAHAYNEILNKIFTFELAPGALLSDYQLANEFNMSRAPVREALLILVMDGIAQNDGKKTVVSSIGLKDIVDILHVRTALESEVFRLIAAKGWLSEDQKLQLQQIHEKMRQAIADGNMSAHYEQDDIFHTTICSFANNSRIDSILTQMRLQMQRARWLNVTDARRKFDSLKEHEDLLHAICNNDLDTCLLLIRQHLSNSEKSFQRIFSDHQTQQMAKAIGCFFPK